MPSPGVWENLTSEAARARNSPLGGCSVRSYSPPSITGRRSTKSGSAADATLMTTDDGDVVGGQEGARCQSLVLRAACGRRRDLFPAQQRLTLCAAMKAGRPFVACLAHHSKGIRLFLYKRRSERPPGRP